MLSTSVWLGLGHFAAVAATTSVNLPVKLEVRGTLNSRSANVHLSRSHESTYPFTVTYGPCRDSTSQFESEHTISEVHHQGTNRLIWLLPEDVSSGGCLSAWSSRSELIGRSQELQIEKTSKQWIKKRQLEKGTRLGKRARIPMTSASGIDAQGPWFDGVELLKEKGVTAVDAAQAKAKSAASYPAKRRAKPRK
ncbi:MAG: hypothetical protein L6R40_007734 [Gallowayella cf. fulva]|nr:MAG: hypothetical protein L6R40_007734 [Xanthomendoza cf. fulva]